MEEKKIKSEILKDYRLVLFGFELNRSQTTLTLIFSFIGLFITTFELATLISLNILYNLLFSTPKYSSETSDLTIFYNRFALLITNIIVFSILFYLSLYSLKKILRYNKIENRNKRKIIPQDRIVNWLGLKLSHGQAIFIFGLSLIGILFTIQFYIESARLSPFSIFDYLCSIPSGPHSFTLNESLANKSPILICTLFMVLCFYSLIACRRGKPISPSNRFVKNYGLVIYIISFIIFLFNLISLSNHLYLYTDSAIYNEYQTRDFYRVILIAIICFNLMISTYFLKENPNKAINMKYKLTFLGIKLTEKRAILLLSVAIIGITYLSYISVSYFFIIGGIYYDFQLSSILIIPSIFIILSYYAINTVVKKQRLKYFINVIENSEEIKCKWFKFDLNRLYSVVFYSLSCGFILFNVCYLIMIGISVRVLTLFSVNLDQESMHLIITYVIGDLIRTSIIIILLSINIYTIKRTKLSIKSD